MPLIPLHQLVVGQTGIVMSVNEAQGATWSRRMEDLGFSAGTTVTALRRAPLGDPTIYRIRSYELSLRKREARHILVTAGAVNG
jgi:ferrous iron transport protein A